MAANNSTSVFSCSFDWNSTIETLVAAADADAAITTEATTAATLKTIRVQLTRVAEATANRSCRRNNH